MKRNVNLLFLFTLPFLLVISCDKAESYVNETITIMPLGDSRVAGNRPKFESYRYHLWKLFMNDNWGVDLVGSQRDVSVYPAQDNNFFDRDHEGTGGARTTDIIRTVNNLATNAAPDVVLLGIGGNDLANREESVAEVANNISMIIDILRSKNPSVIVMLEQIAPGRTRFMTEERWSDFYAFKFAIQELAKEKTKNDSKVITVDMSRDWVDSFLIDDVHYNHVGAKVIADRYYQAIKFHIPR